MFLKNQKSYVTYNQSIKALNPRFSLEKRGGVTRFSNEKRAKVTRFPNERLAFLSKFV